ncbi:MAG: hypothetical protein EZS28_035400 [Streblomastix strix]|uniref:Uncharacterized protein n=1 Tax=Streblomastix strix TaxID=222440 RepID=A0A5J4UFW2_9EUKA|nr:MAG: hypothetical protein EZS28_035400 [Streblomastix strix]
MDFGSIWQHQVHSTVRNEVITYYTYSHNPPAMNQTPKNYPQIIRSIDDIQTFEDNILDIIASDQSLIYLESCTLKESLYSFILITQRLQLGTKLRKEIVYFNNHGITRDIEQDYNLCWFVVASIALHPEINDIKSRVVDAIKLFFSAKIKFMNQHYKRDYEQRISKCQGPVSQNYVKLDKIPNEAELKPIANLITYDFETYEDKRDNIPEENYSQSSTVLAQLASLSVESAVVNDGQITTQYYDKRDDTSYGKSAQRTTNQQNN